MKNNISFIYKTIILIVSFVALYLNFNLVPFKESIIYFTMISNSFCFLFYFVCIILYLMKKLKKNDIYYIIKGMMTMSITLTMVIYQGVIATSCNTDIFATHMFECNMVHLVVPTLVIFDYIIFGEKGNLKRKYSFIWSFILIAYLAFWAVYVLLGGIYADGSIYPYYYMNIEKYGITRVVINNIVIYVAFLLYGLLIIYLDNLVSKKKTH